MIHLIDQIHTTPINQIKSYANHNGKISIAAQWLDFPMLIASGELTVTSRPDIPGTSYIINITGRFNKQFSAYHHQQHFPACVLRVTLCSGQQLIIGTPDMPVQIATNSTLSTKRFTITYNSIHPPLELQP